MEYESVHNAIIVADPRLEPVIEEFAGLRLMRPQGLVEVVFSFICSQNNNLPRIQSMVRTLRLLSPSPREREDSAIDPHPIPLFPTLNQLAQLTETSLRARGFGYRGATIPRAAEAILARGGEAWLQSLKSKPYPEAHEELVTLPGIGRKVADCICLYGLHQDAAVPIDTHIWQAVVRLYRPELDGKSLTDKRYREIGDLIRDRFGPHAGAAQHYLFYENLRHGRTRR